MSDNRLRSYCRSLWLLALACVAGIGLYLTIPWAMVRPLCQIGLPNRTLPLAAWWGMGGEGLACAEFGPRRTFTGVYLVSGDPLGGSAFYPYRFAVEGQIAGGNGIALGFPRDTTALDAAIATRLKSGRGSELSLTFEGRAVVEPVAAGHGGSQDRYIMVERVLRFGPAPQPQKADFERIGRQYLGK